MDRFQALRSFVRVVELGSFARAAERLELSTSAVSRQVADLESHLSVRLLQRTTRRLSLTDTGQSFYERSVPLPADLAAHDCLSYSQLSLPNTWRFTAADGSHQEVMIAPHHRVNNGRMLVALAVGGMGVINEPDFIVGPELRAGRLVRVLEDFSPPRAAVRGGGAVVSGG